LLENRNRGKSARFSQLYFSATQNLEESIKLSINKSFSSNLFLTRKKKRIKTFSSLINLPQCGTKRQAPLRVHTSRQKLIKKEKKYYRTRKYHNKKTFHLYNFYFLL